MIELFRGRDAQYYWRVRANNNQVLCVSEGYTTKQAAINGVNAAKSVFGIVINIVDHTQ